METFEAIKKRLSYRGQYKNIPVSREDLKKIMECGLDAPSGCNKQTTSLICVDDPEMLDKIYGMFSKNVNRAPAAIFVLTEKIIAYADRCFAIQDYAAAVENMLVAITDMGYESCWYEGCLSGSDRVGDKIADFLGVPKSIEVVCMLNVGVPADTPKRAVSKMAFENRAWFNGYKKTE
ncbi:MAG: nitroreductase family protein [Armatimonadetes bacterium]|nr:nitroreductase family protein [Candidatus Hippobium faecium]